MNKWHTIRADKFCFDVTDGTHDSPKSQTAGRKLITSKHLKGTILILIQLIGSARQITRK